MEGLVKSEHRGGEIMSCRQREMGGESEVSHNVTDQRAKLAA